MRLQFRHLGRSCNTITDLACLQIIFYLPSMYSMHLGYCLASSGLRTGNTSSPDETPRRTARRGPTTHVLEQRTGAT